MKYLKYIYPYLKTLLLYKPFFKMAGKQIVIFCPIKITPRFMLMGNRISIWNHARIEGVAEYQGVKFNPEIIINDRVTIQQNLHLTCAKKIEIGKNTAIAANVSVTDINHGYERVDIPPERQAIDVTAVCIGEDCKIYNNVVILPGTILGKHNVVGANSVVKGEFPDYCVIAGAPAKIIKRYNPETSVWEKTDPKGNFTT